MVTDPREAAIDIHKAVFEAAVLEHAGGELVEERFAASREALIDWVDEWEGRLEAVAIEATTGCGGWRELLPPGVAGAGGHPAPARLVELPAVVDT